MGWVIKSGSGKYLTRNHSRTIYTRALREARVFTSWNEAAYLALRDEVILSWEQALGEVK